MLAPCCPYGFGKCDDGCAANVDEGESVGFGCTAPSCLNERAKSGSDASRLISIFLHVSLVCLFACVEKMEGLKLEGKIQI